MFYKRRRSDGAIHCKIPFIQILKTGKRKKNCATNQNNNYVLKGVAREDRRSF